MGEKNNFGLERYIPADVRREVRRRCGYGCVCCGLAIYDYEHFDPEFCNAKEHRADGITLLCMQCHGKKTRGRLSLETVIARNSNPKCLQQGFAKEEFDFGDRGIEVHFASCIFKNCDGIIEINGRNVLEIKPSNEIGEPYLLSGFFTNEKGHLSLRIEDNVYTVFNESWDVENNGSTITIRSSKGNISLKLCVKPPNLIIIEQIMMFVDGVYLIGNEKTLGVVSSDGRCFFIEGGFIFDKFKKGIQISGPSRRG